MQFKKFFLSLFLIAVFVMYAFWRPRFTEIPAITPITAEGVISANTPLATPTSTPSQSNTTYADGEYAGNPADAYYGTIQVKAKIQNGVIADVQFLDYPHDRPNSIRVNTYAMPLLKAEAIKVQTAKVDTVSGATFTSAAFVESLTSALLKAKII